MDNMCVFMNWVVKGDPKVEELSSGGKRVNFAAQAPRPNSKNVWNKLYFTGFGDVSEEIVKAKVKSGSVVTITAEQQVYIDKAGKMQHNYKVSGIQITPAPASWQKNKEKSAEEQKPEKNEQSPQPRKEKKTNGDVNGYQEMMDFMKA